MVKKKDDIFEVFFRKKPAMILMALRKSTRNRYGSVLAKEVDCTYSHAVKILQEMVGICYSFITGDIPANLCGLDLAGLSHQEFHKSDTIFRIFCVL